VDSLAVFGGKIASNWTHRNWNKTHVLFLGFLVVSAVSFLGQKRFTWVVTRLKHMYLKLMCRGEQGWMGQQN
jgi:hypothetical protein